MERTMRAVTDALLVGDVGNVDFARKEAHSVLDTGRF